MYNQHIIHGGVHRESILTSDKEKENQNANNDHHKCRNQEGPGPEDIIT